MSPQSSSTVAELSLPLQRSDLRLGAYAVPVETDEQLRRRWQFSDADRHLERHSMLADGSATALLTPDAKVCWMTHPLPESGSIFGHILGGDAAGHFSIEPATNPRALHQRYVENTMIVQTCWANVTVIDYLEPAPDGITNLVRVLSGTGAVRVVFAPRPEYANASFDMVLQDETVQVTGGPHPISLFAPGVAFSIAPDGPHYTASADIDLQDKPIVLNLRCGDAGAYRPDPADEPARRFVVAAHTRQWVRSLTTPDVQRPLVTRSALVLSGLVHAPTGGVLAAPTTSLPERIGGIRNWDYRYCWLRDASMTVKTLLDLGSAAEAEGFLRWIGRILENISGPELLRPLYSVDGAPLAAESIVDNLPGYAGSFPVRIGNAADRQVQLDVFGSIAELIEGLSAFRHHLADSQWELLEKMASAVVARWREPDHGIWEARRSPRHHVYSKVMCWVTLDRAIRTAERHRRLPDPRWIQEASVIRAEVLAKGWDDAAASYTVAYDSPDVDAAVLHIGLSGLLDVWDPRFQDTVAAVERELRVGPTVFRYRYDDGLPGLEGGFHICTAWLIEAYLAVGRQDDAEQLFRELVSLTGPTGLLSEEYDPVTQTHLGNYPQAYSHLGLIRCARLIDTSRRTTVQRTASQTPASVGA